MQEWSTDSKVLQNVLPGIAFCCLDDEFNEQAICPLLMAYKLHRRLEHLKNRLQIVKAGHTYYEPEVAKGCIDGLNYLGDIVQPKSRKSRTDPHPNPNLNPQPYPNPAEDC